MVSWLKKKIEYAAEKTNFLSGRNSQLTVRIVSRHGKDCHRGSQERICLATRSALGGPKLDMTTIV
jgi:transposase